jgi:hypothetical protein
LLALAWPVDIESQAKAVAFRQSCATSGKSKKFLVGLMTTYSDLVKILSKIKQNFDKEEPTCHK